MAPPFRYFALIWDVADATGEENAIRLSHRLSEVSPSLTVVLDVRGLRVLATARGQGAAGAHLLARQSGVVLGTLFPTKDAAKAHDRAPIFSDNETDEILATQGRWLIDACWGRYVAFIHGAERGAVWVLKDPTGRLPCFVALHGGLAVVFSYMNDAVASGAFPLEMNWSYVRARVALGMARPNDTGIRAVSELCGGECLQFHKGKLSRDLYWDPAFRAGDVIEEPLLASQLIRDRTRACVHAWASEHETWLHRLSGGLDSSIVLACLADAPTRPRVVCLTYWWADSTSNERPWARLAAAHSHAEHVEHSRVPRMNFATLAAMRLFASPPSSSSFLETDRIERELANRYGATALCTGDGGDSLFGSSAARFSISDYWRQRGLRLSLLRLASDVALLRNRTVWEVLASTVQREVFRRRDPQELAQMRVARQLVAREVREPLLVEPNAVNHPWFKSGRVALSVKELLSFLTTPEQFYDPLSSPDEVGVESVFPLLSQPLVELCMRIPSYVHFDQGRDRGLARRAFANDVPAPLLERTWKDRAQGFPEAILQANLDYIRPMLMDGNLVKQGYLDRKALERTFVGSALKDTASVGEILDHVLVEAWLETWNGRSVNST